MWPRVIPGPKMVMNGVKIGRILMILAPFDAKFCDLSPGKNSGPIRAPKNFDFFLGGAPPPAKISKFFGARIGPESVPGARSQNLASNGAKIIKIRPILTPFMTIFGPGNTRGQISKLKVFQFPIIPGPGVVLERRGVKNEYENPKFRPHRIKRGPIFGGGVGLFGPKSDFLLCDISCT